MVDTKKQKRVAVFIDGSNLYFKLKTLVPTKINMLEYRYLELIKSLLHTDEKISYIGYYVGVVRADGKHKNNQKAQALRQAQQKLFASLGKQNIEVVRGYLMDRDGVFFEKGVDVRLAVDISTLAAEKRYDTAFVVSSDTDLIPAIQKAQQYKRDVVYVGFEHQPSIALIRHADSMRVISRKGAEKYTARPFKIKHFDQG